jgi:hypothetical protein
MEKCGDDVYYVTYQNAGAFIGGSFLTMVVLGEGDMYDGSLRSSEILNVTDIVVEDGITSIGKYAFADFHQLVVVRLGSHVDHIKEYAFHDCENLERMYLELVLVHLQVLQRMNKRLSIIMDKYK